MKKLIALLLALVLVLGLVACGAKTEEQAPEAGTETEAEPEVKEYKVAYCFMTLGDASIAQIKEDAEREAEALGVKLYTSDAGMDAQTQISDVENMINLGVDCIIIQPYDAESLVPVLTEAKEAGIKIMNFGPEGKIYDLYYQNDYSLSATDECAAVIEYAVENLGGTAKIAYIAMSTNKNAVMKHDIFMDYLEQNKGDNAIEVVAEGYGNDSAAGLAQMETILQAHDDIDIVVTTGDGAALGVAEALKAAGIGPDRTVVFASDITKLGCEAILDPNNNIIFSQSVDSLVLGKNCVDFAVDLIEGTKGTTEKEKIPFTVERVTVDNAQEYLDQFNAKA